MTDPYIDRPNRRVHTGTRWVTFRSEEVFRLFLYLVANRTHVVHRRSMIAHLWSESSPDDPNNYNRLSQRMILLHRYLRDSPRWRIVAHHGLGVQLADNWKPTETAHDTD